MTLALDENPAKYQIRAYQPGLIQVNELTYTHSVIVTPERLVEPWSPQTLAELTADHLAIIIELSPAILLIGTGHVLHFPALAVYGDLINAGIGIEIMDTHAACRTYTALTAENRNVAAALLIK